MNSTTPIDPDENKNDTSDDIGALRGMTSGLFTAVISVWILT